MQKRRRSLNRLKTIVKDRSNKTQDPLEKLLREILQEKSLSGLFWKTLYKLMVFSGMIPTRSLHKNFCRMFRICTRSLVSARETSAMALHERLATHHKTDLSESLVDLLQDVFQTSHCAQGHVDMSKCRRSDTPRTNCSHHHPCAEPILESYSSTARLPS